MIHVDLLKLDEWSLFSFRKDRMDRGGGWSESGWFGGWGLTYERVVKFKRHDLVHLFEIFIV